MQQVLMSILRLQDVVSLLESEELLGATSNFRWRGNQAKVAHLHKQRAIESILNTELHVGL